MLFVESDGRWVAIFTKRPAFLRSRVTETRRPVWFGDAAPLTRMRPERIRFRNPMVVTIRSTLGVAVACDIRLAVSTTVTVTVNVPALAYVCSAMAPA